MQEHDLPRCNRQGRTGQHRKATEDGDGVAEFDDGLSGRGHVHDTLFGHPHHRELPVNPLWTGLSADSQVRPVGSDRLADDLTSAGRRTIELVVDQDHVATGSVEQ